MRQREARHHSTSYINQPVSWNTLPQTPVLQGWLHDSVFCSVMHYPDQSWAPLSPPCPYIYINGLEMGSCQTECHLAQPVFTFCLAECLKRGKLVHVWCVRFRSVKDRQHGDLEGHGNWPTVGVLLEQLRLCNEIDPLEYYISDWYGPRISCKWVLRRQRSLPPISIPLVLLTHDLDAVPLQDLELQASVE